MIEILKQAFIDSKMSMRSLSKQANVPYASVHGTLVGNRNPQFTTITKLCKILNLELRKREKRVG